MKCSLGWAMILSFSSILITHWLNLNDLLMGQILWMALQTLWLELRS